MKIKMSTSNFGAEGHHEGNLECPICTGDDFDAPKASPGKAPGSFLTCTACGAKVDMRTGQITEGTP